MPLHEKHLEELLMYRNTDFVRKKMFFQEIITWENHIKWFNSINNQFNYYYVIINEAGVNCGLINLKGIKNNNSGAGLFLYKEEFKETLIAIKATYIIHEFAFYLLNINKLIVEVEKDNLQAINYNKALGFKKVLLVKNNLILELRKNDFISKFEKYKKVLNNL